MNTQKFEEVAGHLAEVTKHGVLGLAKLVSALAPAAATVGTLIGKPEVTAAAEIAEAASKAAEEGLSRDS